MDSKQAKVKFVIGAAVAGLAAGAVLVVYNSKKKKAAEDSATEHVFQCDFHGKSQPEVERLLKSGIETALETGGYLCGMKCTRAVATKEDSIYGSGFMFTFNFTVRSNLSEDELVDRLDIVGEFGVSAIHDEYDEYEINF